MKLLKRLEQRGSRFVPTFLPRRECRACRVLLRDLLARRGYGSRIDQEIFVTCAMFEEACPAILKQHPEQGYGAPFIVLPRPVRLERRATCDDPDDPRSAQESGDLADFRGRRASRFPIGETAETRALMNIELAREDVRALMDMRNGEGWRYLIQNGLYRHVQARTGRALLHALFHPFDRKSSIILAVAPIQPSPSAGRDGQAALAAQQSLPASWRCRFSCTGFDPSRISGRVS